MPTLPLFNTYSLLSPLKRAGKLQLHCNVLIKLPLSERGKLGACVSGQHEKTACVLDPRTGARATWPI